MQTKPFMLIILDGWGHRDDLAHNAIQGANTPFWDSLWTNYPHALLRSDGEACGLPAGQVGNSEVGHMTISAGRVILQDFTRINDSIFSGEFFHNPTLLQAFNTAKQNNRPLHILGLLSTGGVHSHENHILSIITACFKYNLQVFVHVIVDGRDTLPQSALESLQKLEKHLEILQIGKIASISGRYYAMDRDQRWDRTQRAFDVLVTEASNSQFTAPDAITALQNSYERGVTDEFLQPVKIENTAALQDGDTLIVMNYRSDRVRQITHAFSHENFTGFERKIYPKINLYTLTKYDPTDTNPVLFTPHSLKNNFGECLAQQNYKQLRIAETEKYAHVTFFFNGGVEDPLPGEDRILVPSPKVATYDLQPEMSAEQITVQLEAAIKNQQHDVIICNFANADMLGHTGQYAAARTAIEVLDKCLQRVITVLQQYNGSAIITADHGNAEVMYDDVHGQAHTAHTPSLVPIVYVHPPGSKVNILHAEGELQDVAPTILSLMGENIPTEMTGKVLFAIHESVSTAR